MCQWHGNTAIIYTFLIRIVAKVRKLNFDLWTNTHTYTYTLRDRHALAPTYRLPSASSRIFLHMYLCKFDCPPACACACANRRRSHSISFVHVTKTNPPQVRVDVSSVRYYSPVSSKSTRQCNNVKTIPTFSTLFSYFRCLLKESIQNQHSCVNQLRLVPARGNSDATPAQFKLSPDGAWANCSCF